MIIIILTMLATTVVAGFVLVYAYRALCQIGFEMGVKEGRVFGISTDEVKITETRHEVFEVETNPFHVVVDMFRHDRGRYEEHLKREIAISLADYMVKHSTIQVIVEPTGFMRDVEIKGQTKFLIPRQCFNQENAKFEIIDQWKVLN